jgi:hypothetical protein
MRKHAEHSVLGSIMCTGRDHMAEDPEWRLWDTDLRQSGGISSDEQELEMVEFIHENFITPG